MADETVIDAKGRPLRVGQEVVVTCYKLSEEWPGITESMLVYSRQHTAIRRVLDRFERDDVRLVELDCDEGRHTWRSTWLQIVGAGGLKGLVSRYRDEAASGNS